MIPILGQENTVLPIQSYKNPFQGLRSPKTSKTFGDVFMVIRTLTGVPPKSRTCDSDLSLNGLGDDPRQYKWEGGEIRQEVSKGCLMEMVTTVDTWGSILWGTL